MVRFVKSQVVTLSIKFYFSLVMGLVGSPGAGRVVFKKGNISEAGTAQGVLVPKSGRYQRLVAKIGL